MGQWRWTRYEMGSEQIIFELILPVNSRVFSNLKSKKIPNLASGC